MYFQLSAVFKLILSYSIMEIKKILMIWYVLIIIPGFIKIKKNYMRTFC